MQRFLIPGALAFAFVCLLTAKTRAEVEKVETVTVQVVCDKRTIEEHLALIEADVTYGLARDRVREDIVAGKCAPVPRVTVPVLEQGRQVTLTDSDNDVMRITMVRVADGVWTLAGRIVGKGS